MRLIPLISLFYINLLYKTEIQAFFDTKGVNNYIKKTNEIELTNVVGTFEEGDVVDVFLERLENKKGEFAGDISTLGWVQISPGPP